jgi:hypothetical protein
MIQVDDDVFSEEPNYCDGTDPTIVAEAQCTIPMSQLGLEPFNMIVGDHIFAKVSAINYYGESPFSEVGNGATKKDEPDAPFNLQNRASVTSAT